MKLAASVFYNDGTNPDIFALVIKDNGGGSLNLFVIPEAGVPGIENGVPQREKADYGPEGGGRTWHT